MNPQATAGRIVHYNIGGGLVRAAIVGADTAPDGTACLTVFLDTGPSVAFGVPYSETPAGAIPISGTWSWMPYQKEKAKTERGNVSESAEPTEADSRVDIPASSDPALLTGGEEDPGPGFPAGSVDGPSTGAVPENGGPDGEAGNDIHIPEEAEPID